MASLNAQLALELPREPPRGRVGAARESESKRVRGVVPAGRADRARGARHRNDESLKEPTCCGWRATGGCRALAKRLLARAQASFRSGSACILRLRFICRPRDFSSAPARPRDFITSFFHLFKTFMVHSFSKLQKEEPVTVLEN